jgi:hypothetical protein
MTCKLEDCRLSKDVEEIKQAQEKTVEAVNTLNITVAKHTQKMEDYIDRGEKEHDIIFDRLRGVVRFVHIKNTLYVVVTIVAIVGGVLTWG